VQKKSHKIYCRKDVDKRDFQRSEIKTFPLPISFIILSSRLNEHPDVSNKIQNKAEQE
jgi:hypothetical protein